MDHFRATSFKENIDDDACVRDDQASSSQDVLIDSHVAESFDNDQRGASLIPKGQNCTKPTKIQISEDDHVKQEKSGYNIAISNYEILTNKAINDNNSI